MTLDPRVSFWFCIIAAVLSALIASGAQFTDILGADSAKKVLGLLAIANTIVTAINALLHAVPSSKPTTQADAAKFMLGPSK